MLQLYCVFLYDKKKPILLSVSTKESFVCTFSCPNLVVLSCTLLLVFSGLKWHISVTQSPKCTRLKRLQTSYIHNYLPCTTIYHSFTKSGYSLTCLTTLMNVPLLYGYSWSSGRLCWSSPLARRTSCRERSSVWRSRTFAREHSHTSLPVWHSNTSRPVRVDSLRVEIIEEKLPSPFHWQ